MPAQQWIDIGVNLTDSSFDADYHDVIEQAVDSGVSKLIITGTTLKESEQAIALCQQYPETLYCTVGVHPHYAKDHAEEDFRQIRSLLNEPAVVAIGETGLDFNRNASPPPLQVEAFERQIETACEYQLPLFLHERDAHKKQIEILRHHRDHFSKAVAHCFTGNKDELYSYLDLDLYIGITGWVCDERRGLELQKLIKEIPANRLMLETDSPYLLPRTIRPRPKSRRNHPHNLIYIATQLCELTGKSLDQLSEETYGNSIDFFSLTP